jgi:ankyrin repeat protein
MSSETGPPDCEWYKRCSPRNSVQRIENLVIVFSLLFMIVGCSVAKRATRSSETDALLRAASAGNADTVRTLLASPNVDVNGIDDHGNTALIQAARFGHDEVVTALLIAKADVKIKNDEGKSALMLAAEGGHDETVRALTQAGAGK